jgi:hypothetical protein
MRRSKFMKSEGKKSIETKKSITEGRKEVERNKERQYKDRN